MYRVSEHRGILIYSVIIVQCSEVKPVHKHSMKADTKIGGCISRIISNIVEKRQT